MRIVAGTLKGMNLIGPGRNRTFRPTEDRVREALFNILGPPQGRQSFLDLYSGSGAVGIEAASRGYSPVWMVEQEKSALSVLRRNLAAARDRLLRCGSVSGQDPRLSIKAGCDRSGQSGNHENLSVSQSSVERFLVTSKRLFNVIFCDPPYRLVDGSFVDRIAGRLPLANDGIFVLEHSSRARPPESCAGLLRCRQNRYGRCALSFYRFRAGASTDE